MYKILSIFVINIKEGGIETDIEKALRFGSIGERIGKGLPLLRHRPAVGIRDLDVVVSDGVMRRRDHEAGDGSFFSDQSAAAPKTLSTSASTPPSCRKT